MKKLLIITLLFFSVAGYSQTLTQQINDSIRAKRYLPVRMANVLQSMADSIPLGGGGLPIGASNGDYLGYAGGAPVWSVPDWWTTAGTSTLTGNTTIDSEDNSLNFVLSWNSFTQNAGISFNATRLKIFHYQGSGVEIGVDNIISYFFDPFSAGFPGTLSISGTTNQFIIDTPTFGTTINAPAPTADRVWTIPDLGGNQTFASLAQISTTNTTGTVIHFSQSFIYNTPASGGTGNITNDLTGALVGIVQKVYHNDSTPPTFPAGWVLIHGSYVTNEINIIECEWVSGTRVEYKIYQEL